MISPCRSHDVGGGIVVSVVVNNTTEREVSVFVNLTSTLQVAPRRSRDGFSLISAMLLLYRGRRWSAECCWFMLFRLLIYILPRQAQCWRAPDVVCVVVFINCPSCCFPLPLIALVMLEPHTPFLPLKGRLGRAQNISNLWFFLSHLNYLRARAHIRIVNFIYFS